MKKLEALIAPESEWAKALKKCRRHVQIRICRSTLFGAHSEERLGMDPVEYYVSFAYEAILEGHWEWKDERTLGQQLVRIAENRIGKEVELYRTEPRTQLLITNDDIDERFYSEDLPPAELTLIQDAVFNKKIEIIEESINGDGDLELFWECIKEGMKRNDIAVFMEKKPKQIDKLREKLIGKINKSHHFQFD